MAICTMAWHRTKDCPDCGAVVPFGLHGMSIVWLRPGRQPRDLGCWLISSMSEIDLLQTPNFRWCDLFGSDDALMANRVQRLGWIFLPQWSLACRGRWRKACRHLLARRRAHGCMAKADDWLNDTKSADSRPTRRVAGSTSRQPQKQLQYLPQALRADFRMTLPSLSLAFVSSSTKRRFSAWSWPPTTAIGRRREMHRLPPTSQRVWLVQHPPQTGRSPTLLRPVGVLLASLSGVVFQTDEQDGGLMIDPSDGNCRHACLPGAAG